MRDDWVYEFSTVPGWKRANEKWIERKYRFQDYLSGIEFVRRVAQIAEDQQHHPFISIDYKLVTLRMTTWHAKGLTKLDFDCAAKFDLVYDELAK